MVVKTRPFTPDKLTQAVAERFIAAITDLHLTENRKEL